MNHPSPATIPAAARNGHLHLQARALTGIRNHLLAGGTDSEFMLRLATNALSRTKTASGDAALRRHTRGLEAIHRHLTVGGTDRDILLGLITNALTGYSPATPCEAAELAASTGLLAA